TIVFYRPKTTQGQGEDGDGPRFDEPERNFRPAARQPKPSPKLAPRQRRRLMGSGYVPRRSRIGRLISISLTLFLLVRPVGGWGEESGNDPDGSRSDDWITINKDYSSQRYVDLDQITPSNATDLKEICEVQLNEPVMFNTGLLKVGRTLYVTTANQTVALDAVTCNLRWRQIERTTAGGGNSRGAGYLGGKI